MVKDFRNAYEPMAQQVTPEIFDMYKIQKELLPILPVPVNVINVDYLPTNEELLQEFCANGYKVLYLHGTCHFPMLETPQELNKKIDEMVTGI